PGILPPSGATEPPVRVERKEVDLTVLSVAETEGETLYMPLLQKLGRRLMPAPAVFPYPGQVGGPPGEELSELLDRDIFRGRPQPARTPTGQALVKDRRLILNLKEGDNLVRFTDVAASIDPTSVRFVSTTDPAGTQVVEQNFEYDLANAESLLKR